MRQISPAIRAIAIYIKGIKIYPYRFDNASAKLRLNCPAAVMQSVKGTRVIRAVQCTVSRSQRTLWFTSWKKKKIVAASILSVGHTIIQEQAILTGHFRVGFYFCVKTNLNAKPFIWKLVPPRGLFSCNSNLFSYERFCTRTRFETEAQDNSGKGLLVWATKIFLYYKPLHFLSWGQL